MAALAPALLPIAGSAATSALAPAAGSLLTGGLGVLANAYASRTAQKQAAAQQQQAAALKIAELEKQRSIDERRKRDALKREQARRRARFGAAGLLASHSADAVLEGLRQQTEQSIMDAREADQLSIRNINQQLSADRRTARRGARATRQRSLLDPIGRVGEAWPDNNFPRRSWTYLR